MSSIRLSKQFIPRLALATAVCAAAVLSSVTAEQSFAVAAQTDAQTEELPTPVAEIPAEKIDDETPEVQADKKDIATSPEPISFERAQTSLIQNAFIAAPLAGVVSDVTVKEGDFVTDNSPLVQLRSDLVEKELIAAQAALQAALLESENDVDLRYAQRTMEVRQNEMRQSKLANQTYAGAVSQMELEDLRLQVDQSALAMEQADHELRVASAASVEKEAAVEIAQTRLEQHSIQTTVAGMVVEIDVETGEWVEAGKPLVRIITLDPIRVECLIDGRAHGRELVGRKAKFLPVNGDVELEGKVTFVSPELHPVTGQVRLWATLNNPESKIGSGMIGKLMVE